MSTSTRYSMSCRCAGGSCGRSGGGTAPAVCDDAKIVHARFRGAILFSECGRDNRGQCILGPLPKHRPPTDRHVAIAAYYGSSAACPWRGPAKPARTVKSGKPEDHGPTSSSRTNRISIFCSPDRNHESFFHGSARPWSKCQLIQSRFNFIASRRLQNRSKDGAASKYVHDGGR